MRALRDFNTPKIVSDDMDIFNGLLGDLFPGINVIRKRDMNFEGIIKQSVDELNYFPEDEFILKVV
jgi:dynein heavy chain